MPHFNPVRAPGRQSFRVTFRNPFRAGRLTTAGLGTRDETEARAICNHIEQLSRDKDAWQGDENPSLIQYLPRAVAAFFGSDSPQAKYRNGNATPRPALDPEEAAALIAAGENARILAAAAGEAGIPTEGITGGAALEDLLRVLAPDTFRRLRESEEARRKLETKLIALAPRVERVEYLEAELEKAHRKANVHVKVTVLDAMKAFEPALKVDRKPKTIGDIRDAMKAFRESLPEKGREKLGSINAGHVDDFLTDFKNKGGTEPSRRTRQKIRAALSVFFTWAVRKYEMAEHAVQKAAPVAGGKRAQDKIVAIDRLEDLQQLLDGLKPWSYWRAYIAFACLAGPRLSEQFRVKLSDVNLDDGHVFILASKTGRRRRVPIERTYLHGILKEHMATRRREQRNPTLPGHASDFLFPTVAPDNEYKPRKKAEPGIWSDPSVFHSHWKRIREEAKKSGVHKAYWDHGPAVWRHTFGTAAGMCGLSNLQVSEMMGNSPEVATRFYVASSNPRRPWPYSWLGTEKGATAKRKN